LTVRLFHQAFVLGRKLWWEAALRKRTFLVFWFLHLQHLPFAPLVTAPLHHRIVLGPVFIVRRISN
jgi:hypothetical protein